MSLRMVVGLGNPGDEYEGTRHNVGFQVLNLLAERLAVSLDAEKAPGLGRSFGRLGRMRDAQGEVRGILLEPWTFMNLSGQAVQVAARRFDLTPSEILVVLDEVQLPMGQVRLRASGSHGGHNGLRSVESSLGSREYPRLRVGIGAPRGDQAKYVLSRFNKKEREEVSFAVERAADACRGWLDGEDLITLMNEYNRRNESS